LLSLDALRGLTVAAMVLVNNPGTWRALSSLLAKLLLHVQIAGTDGRTRSLQAVLFQAFFTPWASPVNASLAWAFTNVALWVVVMALLFRRGVRLTV
jgi:predicted acyltransferase